MTDPGGGARDVVATLLQLMPGSAPRAHQVIDDIGRPAQAGAARLTRLLDTPVHQVTGETAGGDVAATLRRLTEEMDRLDPAGIDLTPGPARRALGRLPGIGLPAERYFDRFRTARPVLDRLVAALWQARDRLRRDAVTLGADSEELLAAADALAGGAGLAADVDRELQQALAGLPVTDPRSAGGDELLLAVRQRTVDLQQQLAVTQQAVLALQVLQRTNRELTRGVDRALDVTVTALAVAAAVATGLVRHRLALDSIGGVPATATAAPGDIDALRAAFTDAHQVLDDVARLRGRTATALSGTVRDVSQLTGMDEDEEYAGGHARRPDEQEDPS